MHNFISKHATAAHLAILAVAPLFLFPFCPDAAVGIVLLWLSLLALVWVVMAPSPRPDEQPHEARDRLGRVVVRDPLFWLAAVLLLMAAIRTTNGGVALTYDVERTEWALRLPACEFLPGCVNGAGFLPFCAAVAVCVLMVGVRHALTNSARAAFRAWAGVLSGFAAAVALVELKLGNAEAMRIAACDPVDPSYVGTAFGVMLLVSTLSIHEVLTRGWSTALPLVALSVGANALALIAFAPISTVIAFAAAFALLFVFTLVCAAVRGPARLRWQLPFAMGFVAVLAFLVDGSVLGGTAAEKRLPERIVAAKRFFPMGMLETRAVLSKAAQRVWQTAPWNGRGVGSFAQALWFSADGRTWQLARPRQRLPLNGYLGILAERGAIGLAPFAVVLVFLVWAYVRSFASDRDLPPVLHPARALLPLALTALAAVSLKDCSIMRADALLAAMVALAGPVRVKNPFETEEENG